MSIIGGNHKLEAYGEKRLKAEHMKLWMDQPLRVDPEGLCFEIGAGIEEVEEDFFLLLPTLKELSILSPGCRLGMSDETLRLFKKNDVLMRGAFDGSAEQLAKQYGLRFLHTDVRLATAGDYDTPAGVTIITLRFDSDGGAYLHLNNSCQYGGNETSIDLPMDFYLTMDVAAVADKCWDPACATEIQTNGILQKLMDHAKKRGGFFISYVGGEQ